MLNRQKWCPLAGVTTYTEETAGSWGFCHCDGDPDPAAGPSGDGDGSGDESVFAAQRNLLGVGYLIAILLFLILLMMIYQRCRAFARGFRKVASAEPADDEFDLPLGSLPASAMPATR